MPLLFSLVFVFQTLNAKSTDFCAAYLNSPSHFLKSAHARSQNADRKQKLRYDQKNRVKAMVESSSLDPRLKTLLSYSITTHFFHGGLEYQTFTQKALDFLTSLGTKKPQSLSNAQIQNLIKALIFFSHFSQNSQKFEEGFWFFKKHSHEARLFLGVFRISLQHKKLFASSAELLSFMDQLFYSLIKADSHFFSYAAYRLQLTTAPIKALVFAELFQLYLENESLSNYSTDFFLSQIKKTSKLFSSQQVLEIFEHFSKLDGISLEVFVEAVLEAKKRSPQKTAIQLLESEHQPQ